MSNSKIQMVDLQGQYQKIKTEVDKAIQACIDSAAFINGPEVYSFQDDLAAYLGVKHVIACANGTDALQIAMMALDLKPGDEVIVPAFTYAATAEVIALLGLTPLWVEVEKDTFNIDPESMRAVITPKTKAVVPVHLYGQCADMESILAIAKTHNLFVIEDTAQAIGATYTFKDGRKMKAGTMGDIGCTSFFPSKNLGCYGDGGAMYTNNDDLGNKLKMIANHGQAKKYHHVAIGVNSRLDTLQAAILKVKLKHLDEYAAARNKVAATYDKLLADVKQLQLPKRNPDSTHAFHQYTMIVKEGDRNQLKAYLETKGIPSMIYYPLPMHLQQAYYLEKYPKGSFPVSESTSNVVLSLPIHTEMEEETIRYIAGEVKAFFNQ